MSTERNEPRTCPRCGIFYYEWLHADMNYEGEPLIPNVHECPEPYPFETAQTLAHYYATTGIPVSQNVKARIKLGLRLVGGGA